MRRGWLGTLVLVALLALVLVPWNGAHDVRAEDEKVIKKKMQGWSRELGVKCSYCHVQEGKTYDYEAETPKKKIAHYCDEHFVQKLLIEKRAVTCGDCHLKRPRFFPREGEEDVKTAPTTTEGEGEEKK
jgi:hypothetical protein